MQVSDADPIHYQAVLDIANNLTKHYGRPDFVDIQVISFGAGVPMMFAEKNNNAARISSLIEHGVRFYVCHKHYPTSSAFKPVSLFLLMK